MNKQYIAYWIDIAIKDIEASNVLYSNKLYSNSFYHFQQASEKALKAMAFMSNIYVNDKDPNKTGHYTVGIFKNLIEEQKEKLKLLKTYDYDLLNDLLEFTSYEENLNKTSLPSKNETVEYSSKFLQEFMTVVDEMYNCRLNFPSNINFFENIDSFINLLKKVNEPQGIEMEEYFLSIRSSAEETEKFLKESEVQFNSEFKLRVCGMVIYFTTLISHNHNNLCRYPSENFNPLHYYNLRRPIIKNLTVLNVHLMRALKMMKKTLKI